MACDDPINILVVGECGDGKSTLIDALRDKSKSIKPLTGRDPAGVTKDVMLYPCPDLMMNGTSCRFNLLDTPGVGDHEVTPVALISMIEEFLTAGMVPGGIRGLVVTTPIPECRIKLGAQIVQVIVDKGFVAAAGHDKYANIILCGTKSDKAEEEDRVNFMHGTDGGSSVKSLFFKKSPGQTGPCTMVSKHDYSPLLEAIVKLPSTSIAFEKPDAKVMAASLSEKLGMQPEEFESQMTAMRQLVEEQSKQMRDTLQQMNENQAEHRAEMARKDRHVQQLMQKMQEDQRRAEKARVTREQQFELMRQQQDQQRRAEAAQAARVQEQLMQAMQDEARQSREQVEAMQREMAEAEERNQRLLMEMQATNQRSIQAMESSNSSPPMLPLFVNLCTAALTAYTKVRMLN
ncbi:unnamed protein product [Symbiodinium sp. CCMP2592]|nr:unnamed protein product [Symbiodinium sp. CCMP2592]